MKIGIYARVIEKVFFPNLNNLLKALNNINADIWIYPQLINIINNEPTIKLPLERLINTNDTPDNLDFIITIGGDGTFLEALSVLKLKDTPLLGINTGRLGFLADISPNQITTTINAIAKNEYKIEHRPLLEAKLNPIQGVQFPYAINDLTILKRDTSSMITIHAYINDKFLSTYWADGLIISTPTGSTAYSMSAGGPIVSPESKSLIITPIAPHNLTVRPLVIPDNSNISLKIESRDSKFQISLDSRSFAVEKTLEVQIKKAKTQLSLIKLNDYSFFSTLRNKLMWGIDKRN
jgi:NAD+ kinase